MSEEWPIYRFRRSNIDLERFREQRRFAADALRRDAQILIMRADQIEAEAREWFQAIEAVEPETAP